MENKLYVIINEEDKDKVVEVLSENNIENKIKGDAREIYLDSLVALSDSDLSEEQNQQLWDDLDSSLEELESGIPNMIKSIKEN